MPILGWTLGLINLISGLTMLLFPQRWRLVAEARVARRRDELASGEPERFFEEQRALAAYPPPPSDRAWRIRGALQTMLGIALLLLTAAR